MTTSTAATQNSSSYVVTNSVDSILPNLPDPCHYESSYEQQWSQLCESKEAHMVVFGLVFHQDFLVGCTNTGELCFWKRRSSIEDEMQPTFEPRTPCKRVTVSKGTLYSIQIVSTNKVLLITTGDEGVLVFDWNQLLADSPVVPTTVFRPHASPYRKQVEVNDAVVVQCRHLYAAAGDAFGGYKWDLETQTFLTNYKTNSTVLTLEYDGVLWMGSGEDGSVGIWDCNSDSRVDRLELPSGRSRKQSWVSDIVKHGDWWVVAGGRTAEKGGILTTWHGPSRSMVASMPTRETPQELNFWQDTLVSVANEGVVSHWLPMSLERTQRIWSTPPSGYATAVSQDGEIAIGGVGRTVNIFSGTHKTMDLSL